MALPLQQHKQRITDVPRAEETLRVGAGGIPASGARAIRVPVVPGDGINVLSYRKWQRKVHTAALARQGEPP